MTAYRPARRDRPRMDRAQHGRRATSTSDRRRTGYDMGAVALRIENLSVPSANGAYSVVDRLSLDVRAGEIVCIYGLMGAGRTEMMECVAGPPAGRPAAACCCTAATSPASRSPSASRAGLVLDARGPPARRAGADDDRRPEPVARLDRRLHPRPLHLAQARAGADRPRDPRGAHQDRRRRRDDRLAVGRQPAEGRDRQDAGDRTRRSCCSTSRPAASTSAPRPRCSGCWPRARGAASRSSTRPPRSASACRSPTASSSCQGQDLGRVRPRRLQGADHGRLGRGRPRATARRRARPRPCDVVADLHQDDLPLEALGLAGAKLLAAEIGAGRDVLIGVSHGRTLLACVETLAAAPAPNLRVVSLMGGLTRKAGANPHEVVDRLAERTGGRGHDDAGAVHGQQRRRPRRARPAEGRRRGAPSWRSAAT